MRKEHIASLVKKQLFVRTVNGYSYALMHEHDSHNHTPPRNYNTIRL